MNAHLVPDPVAVLASSKSWIARVPRRVFPPSAEDISIASMTAARRPCSSASRSFWIKTPLDAEPRWIEAAQRLDRTL